MSELILTPNFDKKTAKFRGVVAGGEHVSVVLKDCAEIETEGLRVRVLDGRKMVAIFPHLETDEFVVSENDLTFTLNLNTSELLDSLSRLCEKEFFFIIDNPSDDVRRLYADGFHSIKKWKMIEGSDIPVSLDDYQTTIERFEGRLGEVEGKVYDSDKKAGDALSATTSFQGELSSLGKRVSINKQDISENIGAVELLDAKANRHIEDKNNPHNVTAEQLGLGNVVSDIGKLNSKLATVNENIAANEQGIAEAKNTADTALETANKKANKATSISGYGITDAYTKSEVDAKVSSVYRPKGSKPNFAEIEAVQNPEIGDVYNALDTGDNYAWVKDNDRPNGFWDKLSGNVDLSEYDTREQADEKVDDKLKSYTKTVNGKTGAVELTASDVGAADAFGVGDGLNMSEGQTWHKWNVNSYTGGENEVYTYDADGGQVYRSDGMPFQDVYITEYSDSSTGFVVYTELSPPQEATPVGEAQRSSVLSLSPSVRQQIEDNTEAISKKQEELPSIYPDDPSSVNQYNIEVRTAQVAHTAYADQNGANIAKTYATKSELATKVGMGAEYVKIGPATSLDGTYIDLDLSKRVNTFQFSSDNGVYFVMPDVRNVTDVLTFEVVADCTQYVPQIGFYEFQESGSPGTTADIKWADGTPTLEVGNIYLLVFRWMPINGGTWLANVQMSWEA